jgi:choline dehydrogenase
MRGIFQKIEHNNYLPRGTPGHGFDGFFQTSMPPVTTIDQPIKAITDSMARSLGLDPGRLIPYLNIDPNMLDPARDQTQGIFGFPFHTYPNGDRFSSRSYIEDTVKADFPLIISMNSLATRVLWADSTSTEPNCKPKAIGIEYLKGKAVYRADRRSTPENRGTLKQAFARKDVIISGGALSSPQLLKLSGVGPAAELSRFNISLVVDAPGVGTNLMDNEEMPIVGQITTTPPNNGSGGGMAPGCVMLRTAHASSPDRDIFIMHGPRALRGFYPKDQDNEALAVDPPGTYGISIVKQFPQNRKGTVLLKSADPRDVPDISINLYAEGEDVDLGAIKDVVAWARRVYASVEAPYGPVKSVEPPCKGPPDAAGYCPGADDDDWIMGQTFGHHPTSTCKIGGGDDKMAVLDSHFRVRGVSNLRVVDASAFPRTPGVFPVLATFMLSQKAANTILNEPQISFTGDTC